METKFLEQFTEVLELEQPVRMENNFRECKNWDSLDHLTAISFLDEEYGIVIPRDLFLEMNSLREIYDYIEAHKED